MFEFGHRARVCNSLFLSWMHICARIAILNANYGGPGALYYLYVTICEDLEEMFAPALTFIHLGGLPEASDKLGVLFPESGPPVPQVAGYHMWALPRFFFAGSVKTTSVAVI